MSDDVEKMDIPKHREKEMNKPQVIAKNSIYLFTVLHNFI